MFSQGCLVSVDDSPSGVETPPASLCGLWEVELNQLDPTWILPPLPRCSPQQQGPASTWGGLRSEFSLSAVNSSSCLKEEISSFLVCEAAQLFKKIG